MRRIIFGITFSISTLLLSAQSTPTEENGFTPKITLPSPEAFSFTRYGDIPVGLFTGSMSYSVPLFQISSGKLSIPISLDYTTNGIKVDAVSGRTGMDWNLKAGGVITRNIMARPDDGNALVTPSDWDSSTLTFYNYVKLAAQLNSNTQPDEFSYSFLGLSGKFYFDYNGDIREITPSGMKITANSTYDYFQITGTDGTKYYFSSPEETYSYSLFGDNNALNNSSGGRSAWYLTKIKNIYGDSVEYNYQLVNDISEPITYVSGISQTYKGVGNGDSYGFQAHYFKASNCAPFGASDYMTHAGNYGAIGTNTDVRLTSMNVRKLTEVTFKGGKLIFYYSSRDDLPGEQKLDSIDLISTQTNTRVKSIGLDYMYSQSAGFTTPKNLLPPLMDTLQVEHSYLKKRLFLQKVKFFNNDKSDYQQYQFEYDAINDLPPRLSFAQDYFGYFNGKNNSYFVPDNTIYQNRFALNTVTSNRAIDTAYSKKGVLTKITYPTGGYSQINYQSNYLANYIGTREIFDTVSVSLNYSGTNFSAYSNTFNVNTLPLKVNLTAEWITPPDYNGPLDDSNVIFKIIRVETGLNVLASNYNVLPNNPVEIYDPLYILNTEYDYQLYLEGGNPNVRAKAEFIHFRYVSDTVENYPTAGLRVGIIKNYTSSGQQAGFKRFDYNKPDGKSSGSAILRFINGSDFSYPERGIVSDQFAGNYVLSSSSFFGDYTNDYGSINYQYATETFDSLGLGGSIHTEFKLAENTIPSTFACIPPTTIDDYSPYLIPNAPKTNTGYLAGKELKKTWYRKDGGLSKKVKDVSNYYSIDTRLYHVDSFYVVKEAWPRSTRNANTKYFSDFDINEYKRISAWVHLDSTVQKDYDDTDAELKVKTVYTYGNSSHMLPTEVEQLTSKGGIAKKETKYTDDVRLLNTSNSVLTDMFNSNLINVPLVKKLYLGSTLLTTDSINYNSSLVPQALRKSRENNALELEAEFKEYDALGNSLEFEVRGQVKSMLTDTSLGLMIAGCDNAAVNDIAYTSFETGYAGNWSGINFSYVENTGGLTGIKYYDKSSFSLAKASLNSSSNYTVTYWSKNGSYTISGTQTGYPKSLHSLSHGGATWTLYEHLITGETTITVSGSGAIDELRLHPQKAFMATYAYTPLIGINTQCDANNRLSFYEYDSFGRLTVIRDQNSNILKKYEYKYVLNN